MGTVDRIKSRLGGVPTSESAEANEARRRRTQRFALPPERTFAAVATNLARTYRFDSDEARRRSWENAIAMRRDAYMMSLLRERQYPTAQWPWHLEPDDPANPEQDEVASGLTKVIERTHQFTKYRLQALEAVWYGKMGVQARWGEIDVCGERRYGIVDHAPVNGDKLQRQYDGTWCVQVNPTWRPADGQHADLLMAERGALLRLNTPYWRDRFLIHQHELDDVDYFDWEMAGGVNGVGLRSRVHWCWELRDEMLSWAVSFMEKVGTLGLLLFYYEEGNKKQKDAAIQAAQDASHTNALAVPIRKGGDKRTSGVDMLPANPAGVAMLHEIVSTYFERHMERLIVGQSMSSGADGPDGLGGSGRAALAKDTKYQILKFDATNLDGSLTRDLVGPAMRMNYPAARFGMRFVTDLPDPASKELLEAAKTAQEMGLENIRAEDIRKYTGLGKANPGDEILQKPEPELPPGFGQPPGAGGQQPKPALNLGGQPVQFAKEGGGRWITIGAKDGHGGSPVYIENGRITKGHPSLTGKKISAVADESRPDEKPTHKLEEGERDSHQKELARQRQYERASYVKQAKKLGHTSEDIHQLAAEMRAHNNEFVNDHNRMLKDARASLDKFGGAHRLIAAKSKTGKGEIEDELPGLDVVGRSMAGAYPGMFGNNYGYRSEDDGDEQQADAGAMLLDFLKEGNRKPMTESEAYEQALDHLRGVEPVKRTKADDDDDAVPF